MWVQDSGAAALHIAAATGFTRVRTEQHMQVCSEDGSLLPEVLLPWG